jgi:hypothetical protein
VCVKKRWLEKHRANIVCPALLEASPLLGVDRTAIIAAAGEILDAGLWCVVEVCLDVPSQAWERHLVIFRRDADSVADAVTKWVDSMPHHDVRLSGCRRTSLHSVPSAPKYLCYVAASTA